MCFYARAAAGFGHVGVGPGDGSKGTWGFYSGGANGLGQVLKDEQEEKVCKTLTADEKQDNCMLNCQLEREKNPGKYNLVTSQCTGFVRDCLLGCKIINKAAGGPFPDLFFMSIGGPISQSAGPSHGQ